MRKRNFSLTFRLMRQCPGLTLGSAYDVCTLSIGTCELTPRSRGITEGESFPSWTQLPALNCLRTPEGILHPCIFLPRLFVPFLSAFSSRFSSSCLRIGPVKLVADSSGRTSESCNDFHVGVDFVFAKQWIVQLFLTVEQFPLKEIHVFKLKIDVLCRGMGLHLTGNGRLRAHPRFFESSLLRN